MPSNNFIAHRPSGGAQHVPGEPSSRLRRRARADRAQFLEPTARRLGASCGHRRDSNPSHHARPPPQAQMAAMQMAAMQQQQQQQLPGAQLPGAQLPGAQLPGAIDASAMALAVAQPGGGSQQQQQQQQQQQLAMAQLARQTSPPDASAAAAATAQQLQQLQAAQNAQQQYVPQQAAAGAAAAAQQQAAVQQAQQQLQLHDQQTGRKTNSNIRISHGSDKIFSDFLRMQSELLNFCSKCPFKGCSRDASLLQRFLFQYLTAAL